ncbi:hypothetical protein CYMTET_14575 [Cymbomonas tetramitiformis]|uniref:Acyltransferase n=1 Tax=Cymbomonas tetramitiformis TaxID=36881 RepID=A0AAE0LA15_9CHLO|nr:hypothetical protein CYMTET_14575 [Cymbomonas tetramitiformis]
MLGLGAQLVGHGFFNLPARYFQLRLIRDCKETFMPTAAEPLPTDGAPTEAQLETQLGGGKYIFGFHPHGIVPMTCGWVHMTPQWQQLFPGVQPVPLVSSIMHTIPLMRDVLQWCGVCEVTKTGFLQSLERARAVLLVPGGQQEMLFSNSGSTCIKLYSAHCGFLRIALQTRSDLVPVFAFGETQILDNLNFPITWQRWFVKKMRINVLVYVLGGGGLVPIPRPNQVSVVVGKPIKVPAVDQPSAELLVLLQRRYFTAIQELFDKHKDEAGHATHTLEVEPDVEPLTHKEWEAILASYADRDDPDSAAATTRALDDIYKSGWVHVFVVTIVSFLVLAAYLTVYGGAGLIPK